MSYDMGSVLKASGFYLLCVVGAIVIDSIMGTLDPSMSTPTLAVTIFAIHAFARATHQGGE